MFIRPPPETDRLYMNIGGSDVIEVGHPPVPEELKGVYQPGVSSVKFGAIAAGKPVAKEEPLRLDFSTRHGCIGFDMEYDQVKIIIQPLIFYFKVWPVPINENVISISSLFKNSSSKWPRILQKHK